ncbi:MAG: tRNA (guanosine(46)-N7)-methyltransferase TrmB [Pirellulaceae bacterium]|jgi:tRNA (guanine-N7-)-methyltransferase
MNDPDDTISQGDLEHPSPAPNDNHRPFPRRPSLQGEIARILEEHPRVQVEIGSGKGLFLVNAAARQKDVYWVGVELAAKYAAMAQRRVERAGLSNAVVYCGDGVATVCDLLPEGRIEAIHVYFPDPWWKARHKKRRVLHAPMLKGIERALQPGGQFHFWTDVADYFQSTLELIAATTRLQGPQYVPESPVEHDLDYLTHFERRTRLNGLPVYRSRFTKDSG